MLIYILKFSACLLIFLTFYRLVLEKESVHTFKRYYLLGAILLAFAIPLITFTSYVEPVRMISNSTKPIQLNTSDEFLLSASRWIDVSATNYWPTILYSVYFLGALLFASKFIRNLFQVIGRIRRNPKLKGNRLTKVLLWEDIIPHTFLAYVFYNRKKFQSGEIPQEVIWHEEVHAKQRHSIDVLIVELLQIVLWFNPLIRLTKNCIKLNHEFLADQGVLRKGVKPGLYQQIVLAFAINKLPSDLVNAFQFSFIKKRFTIMKTKTTKKAMVLRSFLFLPLLALTLLSFSSKKVEVKSAEAKLVPDAIAEVLPVVQDEVINTVAEYNKLARHYNEYPPYDFVTKARDMYRLWQLHEKMTDEERASAEPYLRNTIGMTIFITNDGKYLNDEEEEISIESIEAIFKQLTREEMSRAYAFSDETDIGKYVRDKRARNMSPESLNHIYVSLYSEEFVYGKVVNTKEAMGKMKAHENDKFKLGTAALVNPKLKTYVEKLHTMFKKYGIQVDY